MEYWMECLIAAAGLGLVMLVYFGLMRAARDIGRDLANHLSPWDPDWSERQRPGDE
ncbi:hypothetical protein [Rhodovulum visakhapatnamense]|uniref:Uncharacterized protein n=1 Tax=Rhodovulum visakhapatnamense TaxID=364297 RepID=A0ABS1RGZ9_9RHOB|nr:hypothetical protein [Rhodovulum visakhapatnamense]MBL3569893.1 hypothetical protein [Rhodovulum visakhapatnamense]MBL3578414.1 hypothetical protein [Rhodovulum visakhapatnamense]